MEHHALSWDTDIIPSEQINEGLDFILLEPGIYEFEVQKWKRAEHPGSANIGPCPKAVISILIETEQGAAWIDCNMFLHTKCTGIIAQFFTSLGLRKSGEALQFHWDEMVGCTGMCKIKHRQYNGKTYNDVDKWLDPAKMKQAHIIKEMLKPNTAAAPGPLDDDDEDVPF